MGAIGSIFSAKELAQTYQPLLLCQFEFVDGSTLYLSTHPLSSGYGGNPVSGSYQYGGFDWIPRVMNQDISATQAMSDLGVDIVPQVTVVVADADKTIYQQYETDIGFKGARLTIYAVMWDASNQATGSFSNDFPAPIKFIGTCSAATAVDQRTLSVTATSLLNMTQQQMPPLRIQPLCPWNFPVDLATRTDGLNNSDSPYYQCGYSPDVAGGVGNFSSGTACFTSCDLTFAACVERLGDSFAAHPILQDLGDRATGRFGGFDYVPIQNVGLQRPYMTGQWELIINATNEARYGDYAPLCYGTTWVEPEIMGVYGDGNYTRFEALLCFNIVPEIYQVVVNGDVVPQLATNYSDNYIASTGYTNDSRDNYWAPINNGGRNGGLNSLVGWSYKGDCYGSFAAIVVQVLAQLAAQSSLPQCQVLLQGAQVRIYTNTATYTYGTTDNPAWILMDLLIQANWRYSDLNIQSFINAAAVCDVQIYFNSLSGAYTNIYNESDGPPYHRYSVGFTVKQRTPIGDLIRGVRNAMRGLLFFDFNTGLLTVGNKQTLADQQPAPITGSNYNTAVPSVTAGGAAANGYVAYAFDASSILVDSSGKSTLKITQRQFQETPNKTTNYFFDRENQYSQDIATIIDTDDVARIDAEVTGNFNLIGPQTFDHIYRVTNTWFSENYRGNARLSIDGSAIGDTGGTLQFEFETSVKAIHLMVGQICLISDAQTGILLQKIRITSIQPSANFETAKIVALFHNDYWYEDTYGQGANQPIYAPMPLANTNPRPWKPGYEAPQTGDAYYQPSELNFSVAQNYGTDNNGSPLAQLQITGLIPVNSCPTSPLSPKLEITGVGDTGGGYPSGTAYFVGVSGIAPDLTMSPLSNISAVSLSSVQDALDVVAQAWPASVTGYVAFVGFSPNSMSYQQSAAVGTPPLLRLTNNYKYDSWGPPDQAFSNLIASIYKEVHAGVFGAPIESVTYNTIQVGTFHNYGFITNQWQHREISVLGIQWNQSGPTLTPIANFQVASNSADTIWLNTGNATTCVYGGTLNPGDAVVMRILPTFGSDSSGNYFEDLMWDNPLCPLEQEIPILNASNASPIVLTLQNNGQPFPFNPGDFVVVQDVDGNDGANGGFVLSAVDSVNWKLTLGSSSGTGAYTGGGWVGVQTQGLDPGAEAGMIAFIIAGTGAGTWATIKTNTATRHYIVGDWPVTPDETTRIVILENAVNAQTLGTGINNTNPTFAQSYNVDVLNYGEQALFVQVGTQSNTGLLSLPVLDPFKEIWLFGNLGGANVITVSSNTSIDASAQFINCVTTFGSITVTVPAAALAPGRQFTFVKITSDSNTVTIVVAGGGMILSPAGILSSVTLSVQGDSAVIASNVPLPT